MAVVGSGLTFGFLAWETGRGGAGHQVGERKRRSGVGSEGRLGVDHVAFEIDMEHAGRGQEAVASLAPSSGEGTGAGGEGQKYRHTDGDGSLRHGRHHPGGV